jgi:hypothetical protein
MERAPTWCPMPIAALAIEHGLMLCSIDADFARFSELRWHNPLSDCAGSG